MKTKVKITKFEKESMIELVFIVFDILAQMDLRRVIYRNNYTYSLTNINRTRDWLIVIRDILRFPIGVPPKESYEPFLEMYLNYAGVLKTQKDRRFKGTNNLYTDYLKYIDGKDPYQLEIEYTGFIYLDMAVLFLSSTLDSIRKGNGNSMQLQSRSYFCLSLAIKQLSYMIDKPNELMSNDLSEVQFLMNCIKQDNENAYYDLIDKAYFRSDDFLTPDVQHRMDIRDCQINPSAIKTLAMREAVCNDLERRIIREPDGRMKEVLRENYGTIVRRSLPSE